MVEFKLPDVGEGMHEGEITRWLIAEGDHVDQDQSVVEVQTDKVNAELSAPVSGVITRLLFAAGDTVHVGQVMFVIDDGVGEKTEIETAAVRSEEKIVASSVSNSILAVSSVAKTHRALAAPYVRQLARSLGIDLEQVAGSGPAGRVLEVDVHRFAKSEPVQQDTTSQTSFAATDQIPPEVKQSVIAAPHLASDLPQETEERIKLAGIRKKIAEHMVKSVTVIPHVTHFDDVEMDALIALRNRMKPHAEEHGVKLTYLPFFIKAVVIALKQFRMFNASVDDSTGEIILKNYYHIGVATDTEQGLVVPVIKHADRKSVFAIAGEVRELAEKARTGKLTLSDMSGGTFTITSVGSIGGQQATPIINHPEAAILALHKIEPRAVVRNREMVIRDMMNVSLSFDHRIIDGVASVRFTNRIKKLLENPELLFMELV
ncbi:pyruvate dehydrogenase E2 component (dihydrolipoamide acetyltransferase) [Aneurinibacillus soli]|uniref:Dihydrolipoamide acetyltransferase component of pyruvate dehydrogenase complex n=1 Tax=Aneurinibacillus soli TaxID=1500254 RepID=A0A0U5B8Q1_9BACL|nr:dihydrolipoamide acetyltransferase family protein [Aneurinibacillus soli]PYE61943.1 pyruvate dehydrogenase E2 component (dihydrolipoamide acetyltransferase) [Aneurinibacillus soli]BAU29759.1 Dihydrolipoyllysine-residue acetyltransferase component of pyruvate dehydrogenase complex [Aneurinibacillus soli]